jgi:outer membrane protein OmpA-like peptidoglycan-associated protein
MAPVIFRSTPRTRRARPQQHQEAQPEAQTAFFQPKLSINAPGDQYEREADAVADTVVNDTGKGQPAVQRMPISTVQRLATPEEEKMPATNDGRMAEDKKIQEKPMDGGRTTVDGRWVQKMDAPKEEEKPVQKATAEEEEPVQKMDAPKEEEKPVQKAAAEEEESVQKMDAPKEEEKPVQKAAAPQEEEQPVQAKAQPGTSKASPDFSARLSARKGQGQPLPAAARTQMEQSIGADFSRVRIHTDPEAAEMNKDIHAQAFTHGSDVYFNSGKFNPEHTEGKRLLAHELTHVVQQGSADTKNIQRQAVPEPPLPVPKTGSKKLSKGEFKWTVKAVDSKTADANLEFIPDTAKVDANAISFVQTTVGGIGNIKTYPGSRRGNIEGDKATYSPYEEASGQKWVDHYPNKENDPFYGAEWDQNKKKWKKESGDFGKPGKSKGKNADSTELKDSPQAPLSRTGHGDFERKFESVPMLIETRESLGALEWGYKIKDDQTTSLELTGAEEKDCTDTPSDSHEKSLDKFFEAKFEAILDEFAIDSHTLTDDHKAKLDSVAVKLKADASLKVELGGAADLTGSAAYNQALSLKRANAAKTYLLGKGVTNTITVQSYGFDWARVKTSKGVNEAKNRRVQVRIHK